FGHRAGDGILKQLAQIIAQSCTCDEFASRIGGDEFAIICHHDEIERTRELAERISNLVKQTPMTYKGRSITSTISIGIARRTQFTSTREKLFDHADAALYHAKRGGRDQISLYSEIEDEIGSQTYLKQKRRIPTRDDAEIQDPKHGRILIIDDEPTVTKMLRNHLQKADYQHIESENDALKALDRIQQWRPDLIILDIRMPGLNGLEILKRLRDTDGISSTPVLIMTSSSDDRIRMAALQLQANDFLTKPAKPAELAARVHNSLLIKFQHDQLREFSAKLRFEVEVRTNELYATRRESILCLARTAESRDTDTGQHVLRVGRYAGIIGAEMGLDHDFVSWLELAAQLHDVGKIAIPDSILYKPGKLTDEEFEVMKTHCQQADRIFGGDAENAINACTSPLLQMAARIASSHHERWDGKGYPHRLAGDEIPVEGRITSVADVFDAISSQRHYKKAFDLDSCFRLLEQGRGTQFDPRVLDAFFAAKEKIIAAMKELQDKVPSDQA
ncbi:MAG: HD domain-containing phosphohydrolase, partial [Pirellulaceae bacterium]